MRKQPVIRTCVRQLVDELGLLGEPYKPRRQNPRYAVVDRHPPGDVNLTDGYVSLTLLTDGRVTVVHRLWQFDEDATREGMKRVAQLVARNAVEDRVAWLRTPGWTPTGRTWPDDVGIMGAEVR